MPPEQLNYSAVGAIGKKPIIGILGGIGSGKSTVAAEFAKLGCKVIDADKIAHELLLYKTAVKEKVVGLFGQAILNSAGKIDREKLAEVVFADTPSRCSMPDARYSSRINPPTAGLNQNPALLGQESRTENQESRTENQESRTENQESRIENRVSRIEMLNEIIHPLVLQRAEELIEQYNRQNQVKAIVLDMPLLVEVGWDQRCDKLIFVDCEQKLRLDRAKKLGFDKNQVEIRENFQISLDNKANLADNTIENNSDFSVLAKQVVNIFSYIMYNG